MVAPRDSNWLYSFPHQDSDGDDEPLNEDPWVTLYGFPHAGGSAQSSFAWLHRLLPPRVRLVTVSLPGRGERLGEVMEEDTINVSDIVQEVAKAIEASCSTPGCVFIGHSFGSILAAETARLLHEQDSPAKPRLILVSSHAAPNSRDCHQEEFYTSLQLDTPENALEAIRPFGLLEEADVDTLLGSEPEMRNIVLKPLIQDLQMARNYFYSAHKSPLKKTIPVVIVGGEDDPWCPPELLATWCISSSAQPPITFPGGHFYYLQDDLVQQKLVDLLMKNIDEYVVSNFKYSQLSGPDHMLSSCAHDWLPVHEIVKRQTTTSPDAIAIEDGKFHFTYQDLGLQTDLLSRHLQHNGAVQKGDVVACWLPHSADLILAQLAISTVGAAILPLEANYTTSMVEGLLQDIKCRCILATTATSRLLPKSNSIVVLTLDRNFQEEEKNDTDSEVALSWVEELQQHDQNASLSLLEPTPVSLDDLAYVTFTSGTTGRAKAVFNPHRGATSCFSSRIQWIPYQSHEREGLNIFFVWECLRPLMCGNTAVVIPDSVIYDPRTLALWLRKENINRIMMNASLLTNILDNIKGQDLAVQLQGMTHVFLMGEVVHSRTVQAWKALLPTVSLWNVYSTWECLDVSMCNLALMPEIGSYYSPVGAPLGNVCTFIVDSAMNIVPHGVSGELCVSGPGISLGYSDAAKTKQKFVTNPFLRYTNSPEMHSMIYKTGDRAVQQGEIIQVNGRMNTNTVKIRAFKVSLQAVELEIMNTTVETGVSATTVVPKEDPKTGQITLAAYLVFRPRDNGIQDSYSKDESISRLHRLLLQTLPEYAVPEYFIPIDAFPLKGFGGRKLDKKALPDPSNEFKHSLKGESSATNPLLTSFDIIPGNKRLLHLLLVAFRSILERDEISDNDNFFHSGGHSLRAASLVSKLSEDYGIFINVLDLYSNPTASEIAAYIERQRISPNTQKQIPRAIRRSLPARDPADIAVIGMEGIFPGAPSVGHLWSNLLSGKSSPRRLSENELQARGVPKSVYKHPDWVPIAYAIDDVDKFDALFWGIGKH